jgi:hypothetical protein
LLETAVIVVSATANDLRNHLPIFSSPTFSCFSFANRKM